MPFGTRPPPMAYATRLSPRFPRLGLTETTSYRLRGVCLDIVSVFHPSETPECGRLSENEVSCGG